MTSMGELDEMMSRELEVLNVPSTGPYLEWIVIVFPVRSYDRGIGATTSERESQCIPRRVLNPEQNKERRIQTYAWGVS
jgi:hypothetical protein